MYKVDVNLSTFLIHTPLSLQIGGNPPGENSRGANLLGGKSPCSVGISRRGILCEGNSFGENIRGGGIPRKELFLGMKFSGGNSPGGFLRGEEFSRRGGFSGGVFSGGGG